MPFTDVSDIYLMLHEDAINKIIAYLMKCRPRYFNHGSQYFFNYPSHCCIPISQYEMSKLDRIEVVGTAGTLFVDYSIQLREPKFDFYPQTHDLPSPLSLKKQEFSFQALAKIKMAFPDTPLDYMPPDYESPNPTHYTEPIIPPNLIAHPACGCLTLRIAVTGNIGVKTEPVSDSVTHIDTSQVLYPVALAVEIEELSPDSLECMLEQYGLLALRHGLLNKIELRLETLSLEFLRVLLNEKQTPNPSIKKDALHVWVDIRFL